MIFVLYQALITVHEPHTFREATFGPLWHQAINIIELLYCNCIFVPLVLLLYAYIKVPLGTGLYTYTYTNTET